MGSLIPGETLIYERVGSQIYARYPNRPDIPRWCIGGDAPTILAYKDYEGMLNLADSNPTFKKQFDKVINLYYILKEEGYDG
jgi:hypothetical protein